MFSHVFVGVSDFDRAMSFYTALMPTLGNELRFCDRSRPWAGWQCRNGPRPLFLIGKPYDAFPHDRGNGQMVAFLAQRRSVVIDADQTALAHGGTSEGSSGLKTEYHAHYFGAYLRDPDSNKLCVACHTPEG